MPVEEKIAITAITVIATGLIFLLDIRVGPEWRWVLALNILFRKDGEFRKYSRLGLFLWFAMFLAAIWLFA